MQGQSKVTPIKQYDFGKFLNWWFKLANGANKADEDTKKKKPIVYIDTNAGSGYNEQGDCDGSPVIFCKKAKSWYIDYKLFAIEKNKNRSNELSLSLSNFDNCTVLNGDNKKLISNVLSSLDFGMVGLVYIDPNGIPDWDMINEISKHKKCWRFDILIRYNSASLWRNRHNGYLELPDYLSSINKKFWWGKEPLEWDRWKWSFLLGMNYGYGSWDKEGWLSFETKKGKELRERLALSPNERKKKKIYKQTSFLTGLMKNTYRIPDIELSDNKRLNVLKAIVNFVRQEK